jgi:hypothetical protein
VLATRSVHSSNIGREFLPDLAGRTARWRDAAFSRLRARHYSHGHAC